MNQDTQELIVSLVGVLLVGVFFLAMWISDVTCEARWEGSGIRAEWKLGAGCRVEVDGKWIPEKSYRNIGE